MKKNHPQPERNSIPNSSLETIRWHHEIFWVKAVLWLGKRGISDPPSGSLWLKLSQFLETDRRICTSGIVCVAPASHCSCQWQTEPPDNFSSLSWQRQWWHSCFLTIKRQSLLSVTPAYGKRSMHASDWTAMSPVKKCKSTRRGSKIPNRFILCQHEAWGCCSLDFEWVQDKVFG